MPEGVPCRYSGTRRSRQGGTRQAREQLRQRIRWHRQEVQILLGLPLRGQAAIRWQAGRNLFGHRGTLTMSLEQELASTVRRHWAAAGGVWRAKNAAIRN